MSSILPPQTRPPTVLTTEVSFGVFNTTISHHISYASIYISTISNITRVWTSKVSGPSTIRESRVTKLLEGGVFMNAQGATFNYVSGNQIYIDRRQYYNFSPTIVVQISHSSIILATICGCGFLAFK
jgi:hypothetical protein